MSSGLPRYRLPPGFIARWLLSGALGRPRSFHADAQTLIGPRQPPPHVEGLAHVPTTGPCLLVANHYERPGLRPWWTGLAIAAALADGRTDADIRWMITDRFASYRLLGPVHVPESWMALLLRWVAGRYGFLVVTRDAVGPRAPMLLEARRALHRGGEIVGVMPEAGNHRPDRGLAEAKPGSGAAIAWLSDNRIPVVPVGVHEGGDVALTMRFGAPFTLERPPRDLSEGGAAALTARVMTAVAELLPRELRGVYAETSDG